MTEKPNEEQTQNPKPGDGDQGGESGGGGEKGSKTESISERLKRQERELNAKHAKDLADLKAEQATKDAAYAETQKKLREALGIKDDNNDPEQIVAAARQKEAAAVDSMMRANFALAATREGVKPDKIDKAWAVARDGLKPGPNGEPPDFDSAAKKVLEGEPGWSIASEGGKPPKPGVGGSTSTPSENPGGEESEFDKMTPEEIRKNESKLFQGLRKMLPGS